MNYWSDSNAHKIVIKSLHSELVTVSNYRTTFLKMMTAVDIVTVNAEHYANILKNFLGIMSKVCCNEDDIVLTRWATPHRINVVFKILKRNLTSV